MPWLLHFGRRHGARLAAAMPLTHNLADQQDVQQCAVHGSLLDVPYILAVSATPYRGHEDTAREHLHERAVCFTHVCIPTSRCCALLRRLRRALLPACRPVSPR